jgi:hypothetical protein
MLAGFAQVIVGAVRPPVTVTVTDELLPINSVSLPGAYVAVMLCVPAASDDVEKTAVYGDVLDSVTVTSEVVPSKNCTVPAGPVALGSSDAGTTVAVKVTCWPTFTFVAEVASVTEVVSADTMSCTEFELPAA